MTRIFLIRHGHTDQIGVTLSGRGSLTSLNQLGRDEVTALASRLRSMRIDAIYSSPQVRTKETAAKVAQGRDLAIDYRPELDEVEAGQWTGCSFQHLADDRRWSAFNRSRDFSAAPQGELLLEVQARIARFLVQLRREYPGGTVAVVTHGDVIRAAILLCLGAPVSLVERLDIVPGSLSVIEFVDGSPRVTLVNEAPLLSREAGVNGNYEAIANDHLLDAQTAPTSRAVDGPASPASEESEVERR